MKIDNILDHLFVLRPMLHLPVWTIMILGYYRYPQDTASWPILPVSLLLGTGLFGAVFLINQIYDIESDRLNNKLHFLPDGYVKPGVAWIMTIILNFIVLVIAFGLSIPLGISALLIVILGIFYSVSPIALKNRVWPAVFANA